ncbi:hypothetical protein, partial [Protofrankia coriariae]|uniref:hypothetical protein n=1 Tax=Protofrankia coriariae TaxID=1562887 RepID=UPI000A8883E8
FQSGAESWGGATVDAPVGQVVSRFQSGAESWGVRRSRRKKSSQKGKFQSGAESWGGATADATGAEDAFMLFQSGAE